MLKLGKSSLWGISIALSWTWGLGLFFSVQMALQFGLAGLLSFAIPNAIGLMLFGLLTQRIGKRYETAREMENHFFKTSHSMRYVILAYQMVAITLTFFAIFRYMFQPLGVDLVLVVMVMLGAAMLLGEQFDIARIKWSHLVMFLVLLLAMAGIVGGLGSWMDSNGVDWTIQRGHQSVSSWGFFGYLVPIVVGFLVGPWLDVQQWHRAIQIRREGGSIRGAYLIGGSIFFCILIFHGVLALTVWPVHGEALVFPAADGLWHAKDYVVRFFFSEPVGVIARASYVAFISLAIISTLDSGYVSLKWYLKRLVSKSEHILLTIIPAQALQSPVLPMLIAVGAGALSVPLNLELEYFMAFYGSFSVGYAIVFLFRTTYRPEFTNFAQTTLFSVAAFSIGIFGIGYFKEWWALMALGAVMPIVHGFVTISSRVVVDDLQKALPRDEPTDDHGGSVSGKAAERAVHALETALARLDPKSAERFHEAIQRIEPQAAQMLATVLQAVQPGELGAVTRPVELTDSIEEARGHFEGKWFTYTFMATYQDTNSVGNVYFGMYGMYVGKVREMFFAACMPDFDLRNTSFYILTRAFEHKFIQEAREFDFITVKIRVADFNRKFATLEHQIFNQTQQLLGKGKQVLLFVSSKDYSIVDLPGEVKTAFLPHL
jgi:acyl-CoA thioesterase FadM